MITILPVQGPVPEFDRSFTVTAELRLGFSEGAFAYDIVPVEPYEKTYADEDEEDGDGELFAACLDGEVAGTIALSEAWNGYALIEDIAVARHLRRAGVASALLRHAVAWCLERKLPGIMLETQHNNVAACRLYERHGFRLGGFDLDLWGIHSRRGRLRRVRRAHRGPAQACWRAWRPLQKRATAQAGGVSMEKDGQDDRNPRWLP